VIKSRILREAGHVAGKGERRGVYRFFFVEIRWKERLGRPRLRWEDNITTVI